MMKHQLRLLLCAVGSLALMVYSMFASEWFRIAVESHALGAVRFQVDLRSASACFPNGACTRVALTRFHGWYPGFATVTFYGSCALAVIVAYQAGSRLLRGTSTESVSKLGYFMAVVCFCAAALTGYLFPPDAVPSSIGPMAIVSVNVVRTWAPATLVIAHAIAFVTLYFATAEELAPRALAATESVVFARQDAPVLALLQDSRPVAGLRANEIQTREADRGATMEASRGRMTDPPELIVARAKTPSAAPVAGAPPSGSRLPTASLPADTAAATAHRSERSTMSQPIDDVLVLVEDKDEDEDEDKIPAIESAIAELAIESLMPPTSRLPANGHVLSGAPSNTGTPPAMLPPTEEDAFLTVKSHPSFAVLRGKLSFATTEVAVSTHGIDAKREDGISKVVPWDEVVGVVARRLPSMKPYSGETFVDVVSTAGSTLRILPWTELTGEDLHSIDDDIIERARAFVQFVASRCPTAQVDNATRSFLGGRGQAAQLATAELLARHDERLS